MGTTNLDQFEIEWNRGKKEPSLKQVEVKKIEVDLSLDAILDRFMLFAEKWVDQGKIKKADYEDLVVQSGNLKKVLTRIKEKELIAKEMTKRARRRELRP